MITLVTRLYHDNRALMCRIIYSGAVTSSSFHSTTQLREVGLTDSELCRTSTWSFRTFWDEFETVGLTCCCCVWPPAADDDVLAEIWDGALAGTVTAEDGGFINRTTSLLINEVCIWQTCCIVKKFVVICRDVVQTFLSANSISFSVHLCCYSCLPIICYWECVCLFVRLFVSCVCPSINK